ncbi:hypothetical protein [Psychromonas sp. Urea-02u-13]|uniref:hypothetical protein n=1 Tax=Psychromonas sp. Urea-02u-13 TaxID=2058326 RepID=UPI000C348C72|nr:hypothetical protein [Psychromonas sp. Urea-02u-13]PKG36918.1 hypothetical protein CXF74_21650 [Psychromonas sp. Urea-02u-13]
MKSIDELIQIKKRCEAKQARFLKDSEEYKIQAKHIRSLNLQIEEAQGGWSSWDEVSGGDGDNYLGDGVYAND